jgi:hypothetical protein
MEKCICILEPNGDNGLEGYNLNWEYRYESREKDKNGKPYFRVYIDEEDSYDTCGVNTFYKYFKHKSKEQLSLETLMIPYLLTKDDDFIMKVYNHYILDRQVEHYVTDDMLVLKITEHMESHLGGEWRKRWIYVGAGYIGIRL